MSNRIADSTRVRNGRARDIALQAFRSVTIEPTDLIEYQSQGRVVVIGGVEAFDFACRLTSPLSVQVLLTQGEELPGVRVISQGGRALQIDGHLGAFRLQLGEPGKPHAETLTADMVLDLEAEPRLSMAMKPPGYLVADINDEASLSQAIAQLADLVGTFEKPRYFNYDADLCAHGRAGQIACTQCIDACPAEAIGYLIERVTVDANRCQGGGVCATVCPSGAIRYSYPQAKDTLEQIRLLLKSYREEGGSQPILLIRAGVDDKSPALAENILPIEVEELASVGLEVWLTALAYGATAVWLLDQGEVPSRVVEAVNQQIAIAGAILSALGYPETAVLWIDAEMASKDKVPPGVEIVPANFTGSGGKRQTAYLAIDHLFEQAPHARPLVTLNAGAPFGTAQVDESACTLCLACVSACPGKALLSGQEVPQLRFIETNCLQCGICTRTCPEDAIWITPRLLFDREARNKVRLLYEEPPFCCTACGKPFATRSAIEAMLDKLQGHWMFQDDRSRRRLTLCQDCRVVDIVQDPQAMESGLKGKSLQ